MNNKLKNLEKLQYLESIKDNLNLDAMPKNELRKFYDIININSLKQKRILKTDKKSLSNLKNYAINKAVAMDLKESGNIERSSTYKTICNNIYNRIDENLKW